MYFTIMPDLREQGKYHVTDANQALSGNLKNKDQITNQYNSMVNNILEGVKKDEFKIILSGHGYDDNPKPGVEHLFLVQIDKNDIGKLVVSHLDHINS
ncbi:MAG: hypothetical protein ACOCUI_03790 [bacterium]